MWYGEEWFTLLVGTYTIIGAVAAPDGKKQLMK